MSDARGVFDPGALARICEMREEDFEEAFDMERTQILGERAPDDFYLFRDNGSSVLAVAHLDTVGQHHERGCRFLQTEGGLVVYSRALDDRLGAYVILDMLPQLGIGVDLLLTVGEETGNSTAAHFVPSKQYDWMIEFDRGGTDVVMYQYEDAETCYLVKETRARVGDGIFSDICYLEHLGVKGFNWGVGYQDYHGPRAHAYLDDTFDMVDKFSLFYEMNSGIYLPHVSTGDSWGISRYRTSRYSSFAAWADEWADDDEPDDTDPFHWDDGTPRIENVTPGGYVI